MDTDYTVTAASRGTVRPLPSVVAPGQVEDHAAPGQFGEVGRQAARPQRFERGPLDDDLIRQVLVTGTVLLLVVVRREREAERDAVAGGGGAVQGIQPKLAERGGRRREAVRREDAGMPAGDDRQRLIRVDGLGRIVTAEIHRSTADDVGEKACLAEDPWLDRLEEI